jgi:DHA1 family multidrug resistance protein-like MFS transporter
LSTRRNFHAVWPSLFATSMGLMAFLPVLALYVHERFGIENGRELAFWTGLIYGAAPLAAALAGPIWGALGDRVGKKPMAVRANLAIAVSTAAMPFAPTPVVLLLMRAVQGAFAGYVAPAIALAAEAEPRARHGEVIARLQVAMAAGSFIGPYLGAELTHWFGREALFWAASGLSGLAAVQLHVFAREERPAAGAVPHGPFVRGFLRAAAGLLRAPVLGWLFALLLLLRLGQNMLEPLLALQIRELGPLPWIASLNPSPALAIDRTVAAAFAVLAVAQWVCTPWWGRQADRHGPLRCLGLLSLGLAAAFAATAFVATISQFLLLRVAVACLMAGSMTLAYAAVSKRVVDAHRTLAFAMVQSCIQFGLSLGPLLGAVVAADGGERIAFGRAFLVAAALCGAAGAGMLLLRAWTRSTAAVGVVAPPDDAGP